MHFVCGWMDLQKSHGRRADRVLSCCCSSPLVYEEIGDNNFSNANQKLNLLTTRHGTPWKCTKCVVLTIISLLLVVLLVVLPWVQFDIHR